MEINTAIDLVRSATYLALTIAAPALAVSLIVGLAVSIMQALTQIQEQALSFVPRIVIVAFTVLLLLPWAIQHVVEYATALFQDIPSTY